MSKYVLEKPYVYVVLEHGHTGCDCNLHGVYTDRYMAEGKRKTVIAKRGFATLSYISVLKKPINGKIKKSKYDSEDSDTLCDGHQYLEY